ncbi:uncharacterized protein LOC124918472 [Impatiens glandulifera]|uniref:uncharacterized protein LOC124918472 n=1 Tax=Impatiens glandulifera TaxID=253017 RepID=UPI001FB15F35|nr:uncharacterized protein LOC124918472 [Impatiens glandulifera]
MGDSYRNFTLRSTKMPKRCLGSSATASSTATSMPITLKPKYRRASPVGNAALFVVKVVALEAVRRFSRARCPFLWCGIQALQVLCVPPVKWIQKWAPLKCLINGVQTLSRPLLVLSIATAFFDHSESQNIDSDARDGSHVTDQQASSELQAESQSLQDTPTARYVKWTLKCEIVTDGDLFWRKSSECH